MREMIKGQLVEVEPAELAESLYRREIESATVLWGFEDGFDFLMVANYYADGWGTVVAFENETEALNYINDANDSGAICSGDCPVGDLEFSVAGLRELPVEANEAASEV